MPKSLFGCDSENAKTTYFEYVFDKVSKTIFEKF